MSVGLQLKVETIGLDRVRDAIQKIAFKSGHPKIPLGIAGRYLVERTHLHFERTQSPEGEPWKALAPATVAARLRHWKRKGRGKKGQAASALAALSGKTGLEPLFVTGRLLESIQYRVSETELAVGTNRKFPGGTKSAAAIHQLGGTAGHGVKIPARPFLGVSEWDAERISDFFVEYLGKL